jgi:hypothetical protein
MPTVSRKTSPCLWFDSNGETAAKISRVMNALLKMEKPGSSRFRKSLPIEMTLVMGLHIAAFN